MEDFVSNVYPLFSVSTPSLNPVSSNLPHAFSNIRQKGRWQILTRTGPTQDILQEQACNAIGNFRGTLLVERLTKAPLAGGPLLMYYSDAEPLNLGCEGIDC